MQPAYAVLDRVDHDSRWTRDTHQTLSNALGSAHQDGYTSGSRLQEDVGRLPSPEGRTMTFPLSKPALATAVAGLALAVLAVALCGCSSTPKPTPTRESSSSSKSQMASQMCGSLLNGEPASALERLTGSRQEVN
jgi:hypothetical protein